MIGRGRFSNRRVFYDENTKKNNNHLFSYLFIFA